jgi:flagellar protein FlgJ
MSITRDQANVTAANIFDVSGLATLKRQAKAGDPASNKAVAKQFEALFLQMVLKSMRDATPHEGLFDSEQTQMYQSLLDQQLGQVLGGGNRGTGLAAIIEAQLSRQNQAPQPFDAPLPLQPAGPAFPLPQQNKMLPLPHLPISAPLPLSSSSVSRVPMAPVSLRSATPFAVPSAVSSSDPGTVSTVPAVSAVSPAPTFSPTVASAVQRAFVHRLLPAAMAAEQKTGIPAHFMVAHAALESGWGKSEPRRADGSPSFNLFGIKAGKNWQGASVEATTTEVVAGVAQRQTERFRAYGSYEEAMNDYVQLLTNNPRYAAALGMREPARFAQHLQSAGYATDPLYAAKLQRIIDGGALRQALAG